MTATLTKQQNRKLHKLISDQGYPVPQVRVSDVDGTATVTYWLSKRSYHEIVLTKGGRVLNNREGIA